jgi:hypothetical protein
VRGFGTRPCDSVGYGVRARTGKRDEEASGDSNLKIKQRFHSNLVLLFHYNLFRKLMASRRVGRQNSSASDDVMMKYEIYCTAQWRRTHALIGAGSICTQNPAWVACPSPTIGRQLRGLICS